MLLGDGANDKQAQSRPFDVRQRAVGDAIETLEHALQFRLRNADAVVLDAQPDMLLIRRFDADRNIHLVAGILDGIVEHVGDGCAQFLGIPDDAGSSFIAGHGLEAQGLKLQMMAGAGHFDAFTNQAFEVDGDALAAALFVSRYASFQNLLDRAQQAVGIVEHAAVKLAPLDFVYVAMLQSLEVEADGSDRSFEFVSDSVDETIVLLVAADFAQQENRVEDQTGGDGAEEDDAEENFDAFAPVEDDPAESDGHGHARQADA